MGSERTKDKLSPSVYGSMTEAYDALSEPQFAHGTELLRLLELQNGDRVLDVGCGTGRLALATLERVGSQGRVVGIDPAKGRIDFARKHVGSRLDFRVGKAEDLAIFGDASFDVVYLNSVLRWIGDRPKALREAYRVLDGGGRLGIATTVRDRPNQLRVLVDRILKRDEATAADAEQAKNPSETEVKSLVQNTGFELRGAELRTFESLFRDVRQVVEFLVATTYGKLIPGGRASDYARFEAALAARLARDCPRALCPEGVRLERYVLLVIAAK